MVDAMGPRVVFPAMKQSTDRSEVFCTRETGNGHAHCRSRSLPSNAEPATDAADETQQEAF